MSDLFFLPITRILDGGENELFESCFPNSKSTNDLSEVPTMYKTYYSEEKKETLPPKPQGMGTGKKWIRPEANSTDDLPSFLEPKTEKKLERPDDIPTTGKQWKRPKAKKDDCPVPTLFKHDPAK